MAIRENPRIVFINREQTFRFNLSGLQPRTRHYMYFERQLVAANKVKPVTGKKGDALFTDENGKLSFDYYYDSGLTTTQTPLAEGQRLANLISGVKEIVVATTYTTTTLPSEFTKTALSYYIGMIPLSVYIPPEDEFEQINITR